MSNATQLNEIAESIAIVDAAIAEVCARHADDDFLLSGAMVRLLEKRVTLLLRGERLVQGTPDRHRFFAALRETMDRERAAQSMFAHLARLLTERAAATVH